MGIDFDIDKLIKPYEEGGVERDPVKRSLRTISNALIVRDRFPPDIAGAAIWKVFNSMVVDGLKFRGDGSYGSKGAELFSCVKAQAVDMMAEKSEKLVKNEIARMTGCTVVDCPKRTREMKILSKWNRFARFLLKPRLLWRL